MRGEKTNIKACSDEDFIKIFSSHGATKTAEILGVALTNVFSRRRNLEKNNDVIIMAPSDDARHSAFPVRVPYPVQNGVVIVVSDCHYYPGRGAVYIAKELSEDLKMFIFNGDVADFPKISRHPPIGWTKRPNVKDELLVIEERSEEIQDASGNKCKFAWNIGNHDARFENRLAAQTPEYEGIAGFSLPDHFPKWNFSMSLWINDLVVVKHRFKGGEHAAHNNTLRAGKTTVTGHLHSLKVTPYDDYNGTRWGVDTGTLEDPYQSHADYAEDNPMNHRSGFIVLTFYKGLLLWPEVARVLDKNHIDFRGKVYRV